MMLFALLGKQQSLEYFNNSFFCTGFGDLKKWVHTCMKIVASTPSDQKHLCFLTDHTGALPASERVPLG